MSIGERYRGAAGIVMSHILGAGRKQDIRKSKWEEKGSEDKGQVDIERVNAGDNGPNAAAGELAMSFREWRGRRSRRLEQASLVASLSETK